MQAMFIFWNELLELPIHTVSYTPNMSLPPCAVWKATNIFYFNMYLQRNAYSYVYTYITVLSGFPDVSCSFLQ